MAARVSGPESMDGAAADVYEYIMTSPPKPGGGEFGSFYSSSALHDGRIGNLILVAKMPSREPEKNYIASQVVLSTALPDMFKSAYKKYKADGKDMIVLAEADFFGSQEHYVAGEFLVQTQRSMIICNLIGMGIIPLWFKPWEDADSLGLTSNELAVHYWQHKCDTTVVTDTGKSFTCTVRF